MEPRRSTLPQPRPANRPYLEAKDGTVLDTLLRCDKALSGVVFQMSLPLPLEFLLSLPGNLMGPPVVQVIVTFWIFLLTDVETGGEGFRRRFSVAMATSALLLLLPWITFLRGYTVVFGRFFYGNIAFVAAPIITICVVSILAPTERSASLAYYSSFLYSAACVPVLVLKHCVRRKRPCVDQPELIARKQETFRIIPILLARHSNFTSFPSGDVVAATVWALAIVNTGYFSQERSVLSTVCMVGLAALGRMYFLAHHLGDTIAAYLLVRLMHWALHQNYSHVAELLRLQLPTMDSSQWYHPLLPLGVLAVLSKLIIKGDQK